jgi:hypothetical protein
MSFLIAPFGLGPYWATVFAITFAVTSVSTSLIMGRFIDKYKIYKLPLMLSMGVSTFFVSCFYITFPLGNIVLILINIILFAMSFSPAGLVMTPLVAEFTYPIGEGLSIQLLYTSEHIFHTFILQSFVSILKQPSLIFYCVLPMIGTNVLGFVSACFMTGTFIS